MFRKSNFPSKFCEESQRRFHKGILGYPVYIYIYTYIDVKIVNCAHSYL